MTAMMTAPPTETDALFAPSPLFPSTGFWDTGCLRMFVSASVLKEEPSVTGAMCSVCPARSAESAGFQGVHRVGLIESITVQRTVAPKLLGVFKNLALIYDSLSICWNPWLFLYKQCEEHLTSCRRRNWCTANLEDVWAVRLEDRYALASWIACYCPPWSPWPAPAPRRHLQP